MPEGLSTRPYDPGLGAAHVRLLATGDPELLDLVDLAVGTRYECRYASTVAAVRDLLREEAVDLFVCESGSDRSSGPDLIDELVREHPATATVVVVAAAEAPVLAERAFASGAHGCLVKPFSAAQLLVVAIGALDRRRQEADASSRELSTATQHQAIIDMAPVGIYAKARSGRYVLANQKADASAGRSRGGLVGLTDADFLPEEDRASAEAIFSRVLADGRVHERETTLDFATGTKTFKSIRFPLLDGAGEIVAVGGISIDVTGEREALRLRDELEAMQLEAIDALRLSRQETIEGLTQAIELHDSSTGEHVRGMAAISSLLGRAIGLDADQVELLRAAAPMHDVGKIGILRETLRKPGPLNSEERRAMELHTLIGHKIFGHFGSELSRLAASIALTHHERYDGSGYPAGLSGEEIPIEGRLSAVADVFDALLTDRSYRPALPVAEAVAVMKDGRGTQFDPGIIDALLEHIDAVLAIRS